MDGMTNADPKRLIRVARESGAEVPAATMGHNVISLSDEAATILWVTSLA